MQIKPHWNITHIPQNGYYQKNTRNNKCWPRWGEKGALEHIRNANWFSHHGKEYGESPKILRMKLPYEPVLLLLGIYLKNAKTLIWKDTCSSMFIAVLFTIAKIWKKFKCS